MTPHRVRTWRTVARLASGLLLLGTVVEKVPAAIAASLPQENPNRPPWAQKSKKADSSSNGKTAQPGEYDSEQDRAKIKVKVDLVSVLVSVLDEHNRPAPDLPAEAFQLLDEDNPQKIA